MDYVSLEIWHGGTFEPGPPRQYVGGSKYEVFPVDVDKIDTWWLRKLALESGGYEKIEDIYMLQAGRSLDNGLRYTVSDDDMRALLKYGVADGRVKFFVHHEGPKLSLPPSDVLGPLEVSQPMCTSPFKKVRVKTVARKPTPTKAPPKQNLAANPTLSAQKVVPPKPTPKKLTPRKPTPRQPTPKKPTPKKHASSYDYNFRSGTSKGKASDSEEDEEESSYDPHFEDSDEDDADAEDEDCSELVRNRSGTSRGKASTSRGKAGTSRGKASTSKDKFSKGSSSKVTSGKGKGISNEEQDDGGSLFEEEDAEIGLEDEIIGSETDTSDEENIIARHQLHEWYKLLSEKQKKVYKKVVLGGDEEHEEQLRQQQIQQQQQEGGYVSEYEDSEGDVATTSESDGGDEDESVGKKKRDRPPVIGEHTNFEKLKWQVGIRFPSRVAFRDAVIRYALLAGRNLKFGVSDNNRSKRLGVVCEEGCPFRLYASWDPNRARFVVKSVVDKHTCFRNIMKNRQLKSKWMAQQFLEMFKLRPHWPGCEIEKDIKKKYKVVVRKGFAYKVKYAAHKLLHGSMFDHYNKVGSYIATLNAKNPNSTFVLQTRASKIPSEPPYFYRFFICFEGCRSGFVKACRRVICLDGCFLKTFLGGILLTAIGRDGNDQMFPLAWAVVEGENKESWEWFLRQLRACLDDTAGEDFTLISDQQKGLLYGVKTVFPDAELRNCARHIFANWHKAYKGDELKIAFWKAARAYNEPDFDEAITEMKLISPSATNAFLAQNPKTFCRAFLSPTTKCDVIVNNMTETFNGYIVEARSKHLIDMLEDIRSALMTRLANKKREMEGKDQLLCPRIVAKLEKNYEEVVNCMPKISTAQEFEVTHGMHEYVVDMGKGTCSCRKWDMTGIPCCHAMCCAYFMHKPPELFVDPCYLRETYLLSYSGSISAMGSYKFWQHVESPIRPPPIKLMPGRPKKNRIKHPFEDPKQPGKLSRHGRKMSCSICGSKEHTKKKCPNKDEPQMQPTKRPRGRPKKQPATTSTPLATTSTPLATTHTSTAEPSRGKKRGRPKKNNTSNVPTGYGVFTSENGTQWINNPGSNPTMVSNPVTIPMMVSTQPSGTPPPITPSQASTSAGHI